MFEPCADLIEDAEDAGQEILLLPAFGLPQLQFSQRFLRLYALLQQCVQRLLVAASCLGRHLLCQPVEALPQLCQARRHLCNLCIVHTGRSCDPKAL